MAGYVCIAMLEDPPYNLYLAATEQEPEEWVAELPLPSHLLCFERFDNPKAIEKACMHLLKQEGITFEKGIAFAAHSHQVMRIFNNVRHESLSGLTESETDDLIDSIASAAKVVGNVEKTEGCSLESVPTDSVYSVIDHPSYAQAFLLVKHIIFMQEMVARISKIISSHKFEEESIYAIAQSKDRVAERLNKNGQMLYDLIYASNTGSASLICNLFNAYFDAASNPGTPKKKRHKILDEDSEDGLDLFEDKNDLLVCANRILPELENMSAGKGDGFLYFLLQSNGLLKFIDAIKEQNSMLGARNLKKLKDIIGDISSTEQEIKKVNADLIPLVLAQESYIRLLRSLLKREYFSGKIKESKFKNLREPFNEYHDHRKCVTRNLVTANGWIASLIENLSENDHEDNELTELARKYSYGDEEAGVIQDANEARRLYLEAGKKVILKP